VLDTAFICPKPVVESADPGFSHEIETESEMTCLLLVGNERGNRRLRGE
jgi:hypothetical protein